MIRDLTYSKCAYDTVLPELLISYNGNNQMKYGGEMKMSVFSSATIYIK